MTDEALKQVVKKSKDDPIAEGKNDAENSEAIQPSASPTEPLPSPADPLESEDPLDYILEVKERYSKEVDQTLFEQTEGDTEGTLKIKDDL